ncbi:septation protein SepH [Aeromicrobium wangtongii]|uniref:septation protein SepH n=1 Tax=Aeromicrobium wangtongii TaxID=2969247 RepID=UPI002017146F|nr:septation protein SepH [Aeromicrobium wangtongii]MCL3818568.1 septation protein SepH [Aeromicrobium wangtongii]
MRDLSLDRLSEDGRFLIARDVTTGAQYRIPADHRLTSLIGTPSRNGSTSGQMEIRMPSTLSPRDIQTRIRRGESPQSVADSAGVPLAQIEGFAGPVLAEREFICEQARKTAVRRKHVSGAGVLMGTLVTEHLVSSGGVPEEAAWDSWRREDGRWTVVVTPHGATEAATFVFDAKSRYVLPEDEAAHELVGDVALPDSTDMAIADAVRATTPPAEPEAAAPVAPPAVEIPEPIEPAEEETLSGVSSLKAARDRRALEQLALGDLDQPEPLPAPEVGHGFEEALDENVAVPDTMGPRKKRHERRRVPSWDEIMFGDKSD